MKKGVIFVLALLTSGLLASGTACFGGIIPSQGPGQIGLSSVVLCETLSLHQDPDFNSMVLQTLHYGDRIIAMDQSNGWVHCVLGDSEDSPSGWVDEDFIAIDPSWYICDDTTSVYAWDDTDAPKVALLDGGTTQPILRDDGDWLIISLRGATGWINNPNRTTVAHPIPGTPGSGSDSGSGSGSGSGAVTVYDEFGDAYTLYEGTDGYWRDRSGTAYVQVSGTEFQVYEGTKRVSTDPNAYGSASGSSDSDVNYNWFTVYAKDGSTVSIHLTGGAMYEDAAGRTYIKQESDGYYYCITTDVTYAFDPTMWTGEAYGENEFPGEVDEPQNWTGADFGENYN